MRCKPALNIILQMRSGYSQALARFFLTQSNTMSMDLPDCLKALGIEMEAKLVKQEMKPDAELLARLGITFGLAGTTRNRTVSFPSKIPSLENPAPEPNR
ncbi:hypothetical protein B1A_04045, partial [mine drainage metagenome]